MPAVHEFCPARSSAGDWSVHPDVNSNVKPRWNEHDETDKLLEYMWITASHGAETCAAAAVRETVAERFKRLAADWSENTWHISSVDDLTSHPSYKKIVELGWDVVPYLLEDLRHNRRFWFPALGEITKLRPFDPRDAGDLERMTEAWVRWGKKKRLI